MAVGERIERGYLGTLLRLTLLAPEIVDAILNARQPDGATLPRLLEPFPTDWAGQRVALVGHHTLLAEDRHGGPSPCAEGRPPPPSRACSASPRPWIRP
jgi:hypothetical protein